MILEPGVKVLVAHRRLFESDHGRFFTGVVEGYGDGIARVSGYSWLRDAYSGQFRRKQDPRTKIVSLASGAVIVYQLPSTANMQELAFECSKNAVHLRDGVDVDLDMTEYVLHSTEMMRRPHRAI